MVKGVEMRAHIPKIRPTESCLGRRGVIFEQKPSYSEAQSIPCTTSHGTHFSRHLLQPYAPQKRSCYPPYVPRGMSTPCATSGTITRHSYAWAWNIAFKVGHVTIRKMQTPQPKKLKYCTRNEPHTSIFSFAYAPPRARADKRETFAHGSAEFEGQAQGTDSGGQTHLIIPRSSA